MSDTREFPNWHEFVVRQRRPVTGCIPTAFEVLIRSRGLAGVDLATFQDDFDFDKDGGSLNSFEYISEKVRERYPDVVFTVEAFGAGEGKKKVDRIVELLRLPKLVVAPVPISKTEPGFHAVPIIAETDTKLCFVDYVDEEGIQRGVVTIARFIEWHERNEGYKAVGKIAFL